MAMAAPMKLLNMENIVQYKLGDSSEISLLHQHKYNPLQHQAGGCKVKDVMIESLWASPCTI